MTSFELLLVCAGIGLVGVIFMLSRDLMKDEEPMFPEEPKAEEPKPASKKKASKKKATTKKTTKKKVSKKVTAAKKPN